MGVALIHQNATILLVAKSHDAAFVIYYVEELVDDFLILDIQTWRSTVQCLLTLDSERHLAFVFGMVVVGLSSRLLVLDVVDLIHKALLHLWWNRHVDMYDVSILLSELLVNFYVLIIVHGLATLRVLFITHHCLVQF